MPNSVIPTGTTWTPPLRAIPFGLQHRSGHASVLNSLALELAGIHRETPDPPGGVIERDSSTGEPTGLLFDSESFLRRRLGRIRSADEFQFGVQAAGRMLASYGITSVQDAGADNGIERWRTFQRLHQDSALPCRVTMFAGIERLDELADSGLRYGSGDHRLRLGHAKIMLTLTSGRLHPAYPELEALVADAHRRGFPVAVHCVEEAAIAAAAAALGGAHPHPNPPHPPQGEGIMIGVAGRLEHCSEGTPPLVDTVRRSGATVVTNPGFLYHNGAAYP